MLWPRIDEEYRREIDGIVAGLASKGVDADRWDLVALNANQELPYYYVPWLDRREGKTPTTHAPGELQRLHRHGELHRDGRIVMGHNAWTNYVVGTRWNIIFDLKPDAGSRILMDGLPGVIASDDDFGVTSAGMMITETTITQFEGWDPKGKPEFVRARKAMQYSRSIDEFVADHARRQQRRLCQRLARRRQQDRRDRPLRAGAQEPFGPAHQGRLLLRRQLPRLSQADAGGDQVRRGTRRRRLPTPGRSAGSSSSPSTRARSTWSWASGSRRTTST